MDEIKSDEFCSYISGLIKASLPLSVFHFASDLDDKLSQNLPNRDEHLAEIVKKSLNISIKPNILRHHLLMLKQAAVDSAFVLWHRNDINIELNRYASEKVTDSNDISRKFCSTIQIEPIVSICPNCYTPFKKTSIRAKIIPLYCIEGLVKPATIYSYKCVTKKTGCNIDAYPNFYTFNRSSLKKKNQDDVYRVTDRQLFEHTKFIYLGGGCAFEKAVLDNVGNLLHLGHVAFSTFTRTYNLLSSSIPDPPLERRSLERIFLIYSIVRFELFMGNENVFIPRFLQLQLDNFIDSSFDRWYIDFVTFWSNHSSIKSCGTKCTSAVIIDGHMKLKRRLCYNQQIPFVLPKPFALVFDAISVGCPETPAHQSKFCEKCDSRAKSIPIPSAEYGTENVDDQYVSNRINSLSELSCNVNKDEIRFNDGYLRSCGIILLATNCQIIIGFSEILRSESKKEVVQALVNAFFLTPTLPRFVVYDAGCLLAKFVKANFNNMLKNNWIRDTPETKILNNEVKWMIDRFHLHNHTDKFCHTELNPDRCSSMVDVNTSACEQLNSWLKGFAHILSNMNKSRFRVTLLLLSQFHNCAQANISYRTIAALRTLTSSIPTPSVR